MTPHLRHLLVVFSLLIFQPALAVNTSSGAKCPDKPGCDETDGKGSTSGGSLSFRMNVGRAKVEAPPNFDLMSRLGMLEGGAHGRVRTFDDFFRIYYGGDAVNRRPVALEFEVPNLTAALYNPAVLQVHNAGDFELLKQNGTIRQLKTGTAFADIQSIAGGTGFEIRVWKNCHVSLVKNGEFYEVPIETPLSIARFEKPSAATGGNELAVYFTENFGFASSYRYAEHHVQDDSANTHTITTYADHHFGQADQIIKRETLTYSNRGTKEWHYTVDRVVEEAATTLDENDSVQIGELKVVRKTREVYRDYSTSAQGGDFGTRRMITMVEGFGESASQTTTYEYFSDPTNPLIHGRLKSVQRPDGRWERYVYNDDSSSSAIPTTIVYRSYQDVPLSNYTQGVKELTEFEAGKVIRTTTIAGVQVKKSETSTEKLSNGNVILTEKQWSGSEWATTKTSYHRHSGGTVAAGRKRWREHPDGTATVWSYAGAESSLQVTETTGAGNRNGITEGTKTVTLHNEAYQPIDIQVFDIEGPTTTLISSRTTIDVNSGGIDPQGRPTKWTYHGNNNDYTITQYGCCGPEMTRDRNGATTTYYRDALRRVYKTETQRSFGGPVVTTYILTDGLSTESYHEAPDQTQIFASKTIRSLNRLTTTTELPDADNDGTRETMTRVIDYTAADGPTTTTTYADATTTKVVTFLDGLRKKTIDQENNATAYTYGTHTQQGGGRTVTMSLPGSSQTTTTHTDQLGRPLKMVYADGAETTQSYFSFAALIPDPEADPPAPIPNPAGRRGKLQSTTDPDGITLTYAYNAEGERTTTVTPLPNDAEANAQETTTFSETNVIATVTLHGTTIAPALETETKVNGITISKTYRSRDGRIGGTLSFGRETLSLTTVSDDGSWTTTTIVADGSQTRSYYEDGLMIASASFESVATLPTSAPADITNVTAIGFITGSSTTHDAFGRILTQTDARTGTTTMGIYLDNGSLLSLTDPGNRTTAFTYDTMGRRIKVDAPNVLAVDPATNNSITSHSVTETSYTARGQVQATWGDQTYPRAYEYDAQGRMTHLHTYQTLAHGTEPALPGEAVTEWQYDSQRGWLTEKNYHGETGNGPGNTADYTYTNAGRLQTRTWERGVVTTYGYTQGLLTSVDYSDDTPGLAYTYDNFGRITEVIRGFKRHAAYVYNETTLQLEKELLNCDTSSPEALVRSYDSLLRPDKIGVVDLDHYNLEEVSALDPTTVTHEHFTSYTYDNAGRLETVTNFAGDSFTYGYLPHSGNLIESLTTNPAGASANFQLLTTNTYEPDRHVLDKKENKADNTLISSYDYQVNEIGQRTGLTTDGTAFGPKPALTWGYNQRGELVSANNATTASQNRGYHYDAIGNRIESVSGTTTLTGTANHVTNAQNQYTSIPGTNTAPSYDEDGNAASYPLPIDPGNNAVMEWDAENRLIKVTRADGREIHFGYDYLGRRTSLFFIVVENGITVEVLRHALYDGWNCVKEYSPEGALHSECPFTLRYYTWGLDLSGSMQGAGGVSGLLSLTDDFGQAGYEGFYPTYDGNGNVSEYLDKEGGLCAHFEYDPFGNLTVESGTSPESFDIRFSTKRQDIQTGLYYYGYRYYDPVTGRWPSRDPIEEHGSIGVYVCNYNNNYYWYDYLGLNPLPVGPRIAPPLFDDLPIPDPVEVPDVEIPELIDDLGDDLPFMPLPPPPFTVDPDIIKKSTPLGLSCWVNIDYDCVCDKSQPLSKQLAVLLNGGCGDGDLVTGFDSIPFLGYSDGKGDIIHPEKDPGEVASEVQKCVDKALEEAEKQIRCPDGCIPEILDQKNENEAFESEHDPFSRTT